MILGRLFSRHWWKTTIVVFIAVAVMVRLGIWQLDRLDQRRAFNARVNAQIEQPSLRLTGTALDEDLANMEYRHVIAVGEYDHTQEVALRNQAWNNQYGVHLLTPLRIAGSDRAILVNRGWIPAEDFVAGDWTRYNEIGQVEISGVIRRSQTRPDLGRLTDPAPSPGESRVTAWNLANVEKIAAQVSYPMLPVYIQQAPDPSWSGPPHRSLPDIDLTEGSHLGYALQWFTFAAILGFGYPVFIMREEQSGLTGKYREYRSEGLRG